MGVDAHFSDLQNRVAAGFSSVSRTQISVLRGLGQRLNKQKGLTSTVVEKSPFVRMFYIRIACQFCTKSDIINHIVAFYFSTEQISRRCHFQIFVRFAN